jgi:hypothetical protein
MAAKRSNRRLERMLGRHFTVSIPARAGLEYSSRECCTSWLTSRVT